jgi:hypothetical protein
VHNFSDFSDDGDVIGEAEAAELVPMTATTSGGSDSSNASRKRNQQRWGNPAAGGTSMEPRWNPDTPTRRRLQQQQQQQQSQYDFSNGKVSAII